MLVAVFWGYVLVWILKASRYKYILVALLAWSILVLSVGYQTKCDLPASPDVKVRVGAE